MHEAEPRGTLRINRRNVTPQQLGSIAGCSDVPSLLAELEVAGVFSREEDGTIYSRRMFREVAKAAEDKANGKLGGNPHLKGGVNQEVKAQKPETRDQKQEDATASKRARANSFIDFDTWYIHYPHKVQRGQAEKAFVKALSLASIDELIAGVHRYVATKPVDRQWQNPATWLNGKGWLDTPAPEPVHQAHSPPAKKVTLASMFRDEGREIGLIPNDNPSEIDGRLETGLPRGSLEGSDPTSSLAGS